MTDTLKTILKTQCKALLTNRQYKQLREVYRNVFSALYRNNLNRLAQTFGTDKWGFHFYTEHYQNHFCHLRNKPINLLEIGIGGMEDPNEGGESLRMWQAYFPKANIYGIDIFDKSFLNRGRIKAFRGDQTDEEFLLSIAKKTGGFDVIIDDGSHINGNTIRTFQILFPTLRQGGFYAIEDLLTSYDSRYGGDDKDIANPVTVMNLLKSLTDNVNVLNIDLPNDKLRFYSEEIIAVHFYHNLCIIEKGTQRGMNFGAFVQEKIRQGVPPWAWEKVADGYKRMGK